MALDEVVLFYHFSDTPNPKFHFLCDPHFTIHNKNVGIFWALWSGGISYVICIYDNFLVSKLKTLKAICI